MQHPLLRRPRVSLRRLPPPRHLQYPDLVASSYSLVGRRPYKRRLKCISFVGGVELGRWRLAIAGWQSVGVPIYVALLIDFKEAGEGSLRLRRGGGG